MQNEVKMEGCLHEWSDVEGKSCEFRCSKCSMKDIGNRKKPSNAIECEHINCNFGNHFINGVPHYECLECHIIQPFDKFKNIKVTTSLSIKDNYIPTKYHSRANACNHEYNPPEKNKIGARKYVYECKKCNVKVQTSSTLKNSAGCNHVFKLEVPDYTPCLVCENCGFMYTMDGPKSDFT